MNVESRKSFDYAIIGGGITGLTLAIALHRRGLSVKIYEQAAQFGEIGAGVSFTANAIQAMKICHPGIYAAFEKVCTRNIWESKQKTWFDFYDGQRETVDERLSEPLFSIESDFGQNAVHRARFLDELVKLVPEEISVFSKRLEGYEHNGERYTLKFADGSTATADAILGCDGIKSRVRQLLFGIGHPCALPTYTHKYAYRALVPMEDAVKAIGEGKAQNASLHMGRGGHVLTFPVNHGQTVNIVAFHTTSDDWKDSSRLTAPATREDTLQDFAGFGHSVTKLLQLSEDKLDTWAIFDTAEHPPPAFAKGRVCLIGDAAHASSPHHGAGAGMCIEDSAVLAELLTDSTVTSSTSVDLALEIFDSVRRERGAWLVQSSRHIGNTYEWLVPGIQDNMAKIESEIRHRNGLIANVDVRAMCESARADLQTLHKSLEASSRGI